MDLVKKEHDKAMVTNVKRGTLDHETYRQRFEKRIVNIF